MATFAPGHESMPRLLLVSNRLPVSVGVDGGRLTLTPSAGGLATGLRGPHERTKGLWVGWPGNVTRLTPEQDAKLAQRLETLRLVPIHLTPAEINRYYNGVSNGVLWPLFHYLLDRVPLVSRDWETYLGVNERFADVVARCYLPGDLIWVHDYQLLMLPALLRRRLPNARIGFFLHIPFPSSELFAILPWRETILTGMLGADVIGFHTFTYLRHFSASLLRILGVEADVDRVRYQGREVFLGAFPMGIDARSFQALAETAEVEREVSAIRGQSEDGKILVAVDRLDYTKGIPRRLLAFERLLETQPKLRGRVRLLQIAVPSREAGEGYRDLRRQVDEVVGRVNGTYGTVTWMPIHCLYRGFSQMKLVALYRAADVMLVTPLRDGMNLVAKEFVASRLDEDGVLVLSEFAGAASELGDAIQVNPYDIDGTAEAISRALTMPAEERRSRMRALRRGVMSRDVDQWTSAFIDSLGAGAAEVGSLAVELASDGEAEKLVETLRSVDRRFLFVDYDGTLVPFHVSPRSAAPDAELVKLLAKLGSPGPFEVHLVSGRQREDLETWFGRLQIGLHAEHGLWSRSGPDSTWRAVAEVSLEWKARVRPILEQFVARTPGSFVEEKCASLVWHYRSADREFGALQANKMRVHLGDLLRSAPVQVVPGDKLVEVRPQAIHKGLVVRDTLANAQPPFAALALGDDSTDEDLFSALPPDGASIHVGPLPSRARYRLTDPKAARAFLASLCDGLNQGQ